MTEDLEFMSLVERYLEALGDGHGRDFLDELDDDERERLLRFIMEELGAT